jgi:hypothetical protein
MPISIGPLVADPAMAYYSPSPSGRGQGEGRAGPGRALAVPRWPYADLKTAIIAVLCLVVGVWISPVFAQLPRLLDGFEDLTRWQVGASDGVRASIRTVEGLEGQALCLDFDFAGVAGYASVRRALPIGFPPNYEFSFYVRGDAPANNLEFKLIDASGENVWWVNRRDVTFPHEKIAAGLQQPPGGLVFVWPEAQPAGPTRLNGQRVSWQGSELLIRHLPVVTLS